uniref:Uncharacterized protein n=1 Tax=Noctiluca scintillans TaxID=2966 RepID=A0A7S1AHA9_NOCSC
MIVQCLFAIVVCIIEVGALQERTSVHRSRSVVALSSENTVFAAALAKVRLLSKSRDVDPRLPPTDDTSEGPATLSDYCAGTPRELFPGDPIEGNWLNYGIWYPGEVLAVTKDGCHHVKYSDGFEETCARESQIRPLGALPLVSPTDDPACSVVHDLEAIGARTQEAQHEVAVLLASERAKLNSSKPTLSRVLKDPPAPAPAALDEAQAKRLEQEDISLDTFDDARVHEASPIDGGDGARSDGGDGAHSDGSLSGGLTYFPGESDEDRAKIQAALDEIRELDREISDLLAKLQANEAVLAQVETYRLSTLGIDEEDVQDLSNELLSKLQSTGLEPHAVHARSGASEVLAQLGARRNARRRTVAELKDGIRQQEIQLAAANMASVTRTQVAQRIQSVEESLDELRKDTQSLPSIDSDLALNIKDLLQQQAMLRSASNTLMSSHGSDMSELAGQGADLTRDTASQLKLQMDDAEKVALQLLSTTGNLHELQTGLHPHGPRWWRYRYEHAFIEAFVMVLISTIMSLQVLFWRKMRETAYDRAGVEQPIKYIKTYMWVFWLESFFLQLTCSLCTFLTIWFLGQINLFQLFIFVVPSGNLGHVPQHAWQYLDVAYNMCSALSIAIVAYYILMTPVVQATQTILSTWSDGKSMKRSMWELKNIDELRAYFAAAVQSNPVYLETIREREGYFDVDNFDFARFIRVNCRNTVDLFLDFRFLFWLTVVGTFIVFLGVHFLFQTAYVQLMVIYFFVGTVLSAIMGVRIFLLKRSVEGYINEKTPRTQRAVQAVRRKHSHKLVSALHYVIFFLVFFVSRCVTQWWMWKYHYLQVIVMMAFAVVASVIFAVVYSPLIPIYAAYLSMPPHNDPEHVCDVIDQARDFSSEQTAMKRASTRISYSAKV